MCSELGESGKETTGSITHYVNVLRPSMHLESLARTSMVPSVMLLVFKLATYPFLKIHSLALFTPRLSIFSSPSCKLKAINPARVDILLILLSHTPVIPTLVDLLHVARELYIRGNDDHICHLQWKGL